MRDSLDLQDLQERIERYRAQKRAIRNRTLVFMLGALVAFVSIWFNSHIDLILWNISIALFPLVMSMIPVYTYLTPKQKLNQDRSLRAQKYLAHFLRDEESQETSQTDDQPRQQTNNVYTVVLVLIIVAIFLDLPWVISYLLMSTLLVYGVMKYPLQFIRFENLQAHHKPYLRREFINRSMIVAGLIGINWIVIAIVGQIANNLEYEFYLDTMLYATTLVPLIIVELYGFSVWYQRTYYFNPLRDARYDDLLGEMNLIGEFNRDLGVMYWQGLINQFKGESVAAEMIWREVLQLMSHGGNAEMISIALNNIGYTLHSQGQYEEALKFFEASIRIVPEMPGVYRGLMNYYSRLGEHSDRALEIGKLMMSITRKPRLNVMFEYSEWANNLSASAVAWVNHGSPDVADQLIEKALAQCDNRFKSNVAGLHNAAGYICKVEGNLDKAREHYQQAIEIDPDGIAAKSARQFLEEM